MEVFTVYAGEVFDSAVVGPTFATDLDRVGALEHGVLSEGNAAALRGHTETIGRRGEALAVKVEEPVVR